METNFGERRYLGNSTTLETRNIGGKMSTVMDVGEKRREERSKQVKNLGS